MESRKIQKVGAATLTISLPKAWVAQRNLRKGDQVFLVEEGDALKVLPGPAMDERRRRSEETVIDADLCDEPGMLERVIVGTYVLGRQKVTVRSSGRLHSDHLREIREAARRLMGTGIIEETANRVVIQCSLDPSNYPLDALMKRLYSLGATMLEESIEALISRDRRLAEDAIHREDDADMMYWLILRLVLSAQMDEALVELLGMRSRLEITGYRVIARDLETVADRCEDIARAVLTLLDDNADVSAGMAQLLRDQAKAVTEVLAKALGGLLSRDLKQANEAIRGYREIEIRGQELAKQLLRDHDDLKVVLPLRHIIMGIEAMAEYAHSIAVIAFNRYLERPSNLAHPA